MYLPHIEGAEKKIAAEHYFFFYINALYSEYTKRGRKKKENLQNFATRAAINFLMREWREVLH